MMAEKRRNRWEEFARRDAEYFVLTGVDGTPGRVSEQDFVDSGSAAAAEIVQEAKPRSFTLALEIGCGPGRIAIPMASRFEHVIAVDVAPTMLKLLRERAGSAGVSNIVTVEAQTTPWCDSPSVDLVYSVLVFQHIENDEEIVRLLAAARTCVAPEAVGYFQFDTRPKTLAYAVRGWMPAVLLPKTWRPGIRRVRREAGQVAKALRSAGFEIIRECQPDTAEHLFIVRPSKRSVLADSP